MLKELYRAVKWFLVLSILFISIGCAGKTIYQVDGQPIHTNIVQTKLLSTNTKLTYNLIKSFKVKEDDESYLSYEFLSLTNVEIHQIEKADTLCININVFNPTKSFYKLVTTFKAEDAPLDETTLYEGDISRNVFNISLPLGNKGLSTFHYSIYNEQGNLLFESFRARYISKNNKIKNTNELALNH